MATLALIRDVLRHLRDVQNKVTPAECAMRFGISQRSVYRYKRGEGTGLPGRPRALSPEQEDVVCKVYCDDEATVTELACIYRVSHQTIRNVLQRRGVW